MVLGAFVEGGCYSQLVPRGSKYPILEVSGGTKQSKGQGNNKWHESHGFDNGFWLLLPGPPK